MFPWACHACARAILTFEIPALPYLKNNNKKTISLPPPLPSPSMSKQVRARAEWTHVCPKRQTERA